MLNPQQRAAIRHLDGPLLVLAGAGSGKTRVITQKIAYLIQEAGMSAQHIAAITFTNKAAREMLERVGKLLEPAQLRGLTVSTFHSLGLHIMRQEARLLGYKPQFSILDAADAAKILADRLASTDKAEIRRLQSQISRWKNDLISPDAALLLAQDEFSRVAAKLYLDYQDTLFAYQAVDFDDLIRLPVHVLQQHPEALARWQAKLRYLLVDEYQDTNSCQYLLLRLLAGERAMFTAVGDDDQSIYGWRGANMENLSLLQQDFPRLRVIKLEQNYRSTARILRAANSVIANNPKLFQKSLWSEFGLGDPITVVSCKDDEHEAESVAQRLLAHKFEHRTTFADYAVLYRGNHQARLIEQAFRQHRIPYLISGGQSFFERSEIKDVLAYIRLLANEDDDPAFIRAITTPKRGVGNTSLAKLGEYAAQRHVSLFAAACEVGFQQTLATAQQQALETFCQFINRMQYRVQREPAGALLQELLLTIGFETWLFDSEETRTAETKWKNVQEFVTWIGKKGEEDGKNLVELAQTIALMTLLEGREKDKQQEAVQLSTLHAAKGLEYPHVFLIGCEEGILPHNESIDQGTVEEERRLMYVGITRAQRSLTLMHCLKRRRGGEWLFCEPSRFIAEIDSEDLRCVGQKSDKPAVVSRSEGQARLANLRAMLANKNKP